MKRRTFLQLSIPLAASLALPACKRIEGSVEKPVLPLVLRGGRSFFGGRWKTMDIGIDALGKLRFGSEMRGVETLNVSGRVVSPGFIDILADNSTSPETTYPIFEKYKVSDGVTTALQMHGGSADCGAYYRRFARLPHSINYGVSTFLMGIRAGSGGKRQVEKNLDEGALGVSHSLEYQPAPYAEMLVYAKIATKYDRPFFLHLRYSLREN